MTNSPVGNATIGARLIVRDTDAAAAFYCSAFFGTELVRFTDPSGAIVHLEVQIGESVISLSEESEFNESPLSIGGTGTILMLTVADVDAVGASLEAHGAETIFAIDDRPYGMRDGRFRDPFGHLWLINQPSEELSDEEVQSRLTE